MPCSYRSLNTSLQVFAPELAALQVDPSAAVRRYLTELLEEAATAAPQPAVLQPVASCLAALTADTSAGVAKRAVPAAATVLRTSFALIAAQVWFRKLRSSSYDAVSQQFCSAGTATVRARRDRHGKGLAAA